MPGEGHIYIVTGLTGDGMTFGTMTLLIIPDLPDDSELGLAQLLSPGRLKHLASVSGFFDEVFNRET